MALLNWCQESRVARSSYMHDKKGFHFTTSSTDHALA
ncbi:hypothetical protein LINPERPRIM_LOCUS13048 [Linum perenne]